MVLMKNRKSLNTKFVVSTDSIAELLFIIFYSMSFFKWASEEIFGIINISSHTLLFILLVVYIIVMILIIADHKYLKIDFIGILFFVIFFFSFTYLLHPEYEYVYSRRQYGVLEYVLRPDNGIYAYLFVRLITNPKKLIASLRISGYIMYLYSALRLYVALNRGYWIEENYLGQSIRLSYNLNFGYGLVIFVCCFLYCALKNRDIKDFLLAGMGSVMIFLGGSRGPLLNIAIFISIYILIAAIESKRKITYLFLVLIGAFTLALFYRQILLWAANILNSLNLSSRTIIMLLEGAIAEGNGRDIIWREAVKMIKDNPFGYGAMGARHVLYHIHIVGHPHNIFLEILIDYGVIFGSFLIISFVVNSIKIFMSNNLGEWKYIYLIFFAYACQLLTSYTYWHSAGLWGVLAVAVNIYLDQKEKGKYRAGWLYEREQNI